MGPDVGWDQRAGTVRSMVTSAGPPQFVFQPIYGGPARATRPCPTLRLVLAVLNVCSAVASVVLAMLS
jgi:hypothetical protein